LKKLNGPKILILDIETAPILGEVWGMWENNLSLNQINKDWHLLSWSAKWLGDPANKIMFAGQGGVKNVENDKKICVKMWNLLDEADIVIGHNSKKFDTKKLNSRFLLNKIKKGAPPSPYKQIDTLSIAKKHFAFTSNKLEYLTDKLCKKFKKLKHKKFPGHELWVECVRGNKSAWREMEKYNKHDVLGTEELYNVLKKWDNSINFDLYTDDIVSKCSKCNNTTFQNRGFDYTEVGKYQLFRCKKCWKCYRSRVNLLSKEKRKSLKKGV
jgi:hypothetical protein